MTTEQRRLAAIVSADVAGYSRLMGRDESGTLAALKAMRQEVVDPPIVRHGGRIVEPVPVAPLAEYASIEMDRFPAKVRPFTRMLPTPRKGRTTN
jgi:class 3 adenylate cyclase